MNILVWLLLLWVVRKVERPHELLILLLISVHRWAIFLVGMDHYLLLWNKEIRWPWLTSLPTNWFITQHHISSPLIKELFLSILFLMYYINWASLGYSVKLSLKLALRSLGIEYELSFRHTGHWRYSSGVLCKWLFSFHPSIDDTI
jgi:hypothetical protein